MQTVSMITVVVSSWELVLRKIQKKLQNTTNCELIKGIRMVNIFMVIVSNWELVLRKIQKKPRNTTKCQLIKVSKRRVVDTHAAPEPLKMSKRSLFLLHFTQ
jgi:PIN domain nuclease of toxin-antitoxin system